MRGGAFWIARNQITRADGSSQYAALKSVFQRYCVEVHQQADAVSADTQIGQQLRFMQRQDAIDRLDLENDLVSDDNVRAIATVEVQTVVLIGSLTWRA